MTREAGQRTDAHLTDPSTDRPTNGIRPKNTTASDSFRCYDSLLKNVYRTENHSIR